MILDLTTESPVLVSQPGGDPNAVDTCRFLSGSALAGACAAIMLAANKEAAADPVFRRIFVAGSVSFGNAWPLLGETPALPLPFSLVIPKGAPADSAARDWLCASKVSSEPHVSAGAFGVLAEGTWRRAGVATALHFHHARDYERGVGREGQIFNYEAIEAGQRFRSLVTGEEADLEILAGLLEKAGILRIGRSRHVEYGRVRVAVRDGRTDHAGEVPGCGPRAGSNTLALVSDLVLPPDVPPFAENICRDVFGLPLDTAGSTPAAYVKTGEAWTFSGIRRLPAPARRIVRAGSCFRVTIAAEDVERCAALQAGGAGLERWRGHGRLVFNWQQKETLAAARIQAEAPRKPDGSVPGRVTAIVGGIVRERIMAEVRGQAILDAREFGPLPKRSLTGRLEAMLRAASTVAGFAQSVNSLRRIAADALARCRNGRVDMKTWLQEAPASIAALSPAKLDGSEYVKPLAPIEFEATPAFREECARAYLETFFSILRKMKSEED